MAKILVIRFSSIGDIVLTSPVVRCISNQLDNTEVHFLTKTQYVNLVESNPYIDKVHGWDDDDAKLILSNLRKENYAFIVDLHNNLRTLRVKLALLKKSKAFPKLNLKKWFLVQFKKDLMPNIHVVDRYFETVKSLGVKNDLQGLDFFINIDQESFKKRFEYLEKYIVMAIGGKFATKKMPPEQLIEILRGQPVPIILIGGKEDREVGEIIRNALPNQQINNTCGGLTIHESAQVVKDAALLITHDTGMMHIGTAFKLPIVSIWGNTVPAFGMYPYRPQSPMSYSIHEVKDLDCRPCSKIGYNKCPKGHFKCMLNQDITEIRKQIDEFLDNFLLYS